MATTEHLLNISRGKHDRERFQSFCQGEVFHITYSTAQDLVVEKSKGTEGLVLRGGREYESLRQKEEERLQCGGVLQFRACVSVPFKSDRLVTNNQ